MAAYRLDVISLAPQAFTPLGELGVIGRAFAAGRAELHLHNPRDHATDRYRKVDDEPYGGGAGMVLKPEPVFAAVESIPRTPRSRLLLMSPQGKPLHQEDLQRVAHEERRDRRQPAASVHESELPERVEADALETLARCP